MDIGTCSVLTKKQLFLWFIGAIQIYCFNINRPQSTTPYPSILIYSFVKLCCIQISPKTLMLCFDITSNFMKTNVNIILNYTMAVGHCSQLGLLKFKIPIHEFTQYKKEQKD